MKKSDFIKILSVFMLGISSTSFMIPFITSCSNTQKQQEHIQVDNDTPWWPSDVYHPSDVFNTLLLPIIVKKIKESLPSGQITLEEYFGHHIAYRTIDDVIRNKVNKLTFSNLNDLFFYDIYMPKLNHNMYENVLKENTKKLSFWSVYNFIFDDHFSSTYVDDELFTPNTFIVKKTDQVVYRSQCEYENQRNPCSVYELSAGSGTIVMGGFSFYLYIEELHNIAPVIYPSSTILAYGGGIEIPVKELFPNTIKFAYINSSVGDPMRLINDIMYYYDKGWFRG